MPSIRREPTVRSRPPSRSVNCLSRPPASGTTQRCDVFVFAARSTSTAENITHVPDVEICGSLSRFMRCRSTNVIARLPPLSSCSCPAAVLITLPASAAERVASDVGFATFAVGFAARFGEPPPAEPALCANPTLPAISPINRLASIFIAPSLPRQSNSITTRTNAPRTKPVPIALLSTP